MEEDLANLIGKKIKMGIGFGEDAVFECIRIRDEHFLNEKTGKKVCVLEMCDFGGPHQSLSIEEFQKILAEQKTN